MGLNDEKSEVRKSRDIVQYLEKILFSWYIFARCPLTEISTTLIAMQGLMQTKQLNLSSFWNIFAVRFHLAAQPQNEISR